MKVWRVAVAGAALIAWTGCTLLSSLSDLQVVPPLAEDASSPSPSPPPDPGPPVDSGSSIDAGDVFTCVGVDAAFCDDFEHGQDVRWVIEQNTPLAEQSILLDGGRASQGALVGVVGASTEERVDQAYRWVEFAGQPETVTVSFWVSMDERAARSREGLSYVDLTMWLDGPESVNYDTFLSVGAENDSVGAIRSSSAGTASDTVPLPQRLPVGTWSHVVIELHWVVDSYVLSLVVDGVDRLRGQPLAPWKGMPKPGVKGVAASFGIVYRGAPADPSRVRLDDIVINLTY